MKTPKLILTTLALIAITFATGCASTLDRMATAVTTPKQTVTTVTNIVEETHVITSTNYVPNVQTSASGVTITNFETHVTEVTNIVPIVRVESVTNVTWVAKPAYETTLNVGTAAAGFAPAPIGAVAATGFGLLSGFLAFLVKRKNGQAASLTDQLTAVVHGVETATSAVSPDIGDKVKSSIAAASKILGVAQELDQTVKTLTR